MPERDQARDGTGGDRPNDRDHFEHTRHDRKQQDERDLQDREADECGGRHHADEEHLTADIATEHRVHLREQRDELVALTRGKNAAEPLKQTRRIAQKEEGRDEKDQELEKETAQSDDEWHRAASDHLREVADPGEVHDQRVEVFESDLISGLGKGVLRVRHEGRQRALEVAKLIKRQRNEQPTATNYGGEQSEKDDRRRRGAWQRKTTLEETDHWEQHKSQHAGPDEGAHDVSGAVDDVQRGDCKKGDDDAFGRATPTGSHAVSGLSGRRSAGWGPIGRYLAI